MRAAADSAFEDAPAGGASRGDVWRSLPARFWLFFVLPAAAAQAALGASGAWLDTGAAALQAGSIAWLLAWPAFTGLVAWGGLAAWRAAVAHGAAGGAPLWSLGARALVAATGLLWLASLAFNALPRAGERLHLATGTDPLGQVQAVLSADGRRLRLSGPIGLGDADRVLARLSAAPRLRLLELEGGGARLAEAGRIAAAVRAGGWQTRMVGPCDNGCAMVFLAGAGRQMMPAARFALNRPRTFPLDPLGAGMVRRVWSEAWRGAGLPEAFIQRGVHSTPASPWSPDLVDLEAAGVLGVPGRPLDVAFPAGERLVAADFAEALSSHSLWRALEVRFPGSTSAAAGRMAEAQAGGADAQAVQVAAQHVVQAAMPALLEVSDALLREQFVALLADQVSAAQAAGAEACTRVLQADAAARRGLPEPLQMREAAWLKDALASRPDTRPAQRRADLEREVMRRVLGDRSPALLAALWGPQRAWGADPGCQRAAALIGAVNRLPAGERRLAGRLMFDR